MNNCEEHYWQLKVRRPNCYTENWYLQCVYCRFTREITETEARFIRDK